MDRVVVWERGCGNDRTRGLDDLEAAVLLSDLGNEEKGEVLSGDICPGAHGSHSRRRPSSVSLLC